MTKLAGHDFGGKLARYGVSAGAVALASAAQAEVIYTDPDDISGSAIYFDLQGSTPSTTPFAGADFQLVSKTKKAKAKVKSYGSVTSQVAVTLVGTKPYALKLSAGTTIGSGSFSGPYLGYFNDYAAYPGDGGLGMGQWKVGDTGFVGLSFQISDGTGFQNHYGWAQVTLHSFSTSPVFTLHDYAYEAAANTEIIAGAIPEPNTAALLIAGAAGVAAMRRQRSL